MKNLAVLLSLTLLSVSAFADQCAYVTADSAKTAVRLISLSKKNSGGVLALCQSCGETEPQQVAVNQIDISATGVADVPAEVSINGQGIDLAYTYVNMGQGRWFNLAKLSSCEVRGESKYIIEKHYANGRVKFILGPVFQ